MIKNVVDLMSTPSAWCAFLRWGKFSLTSYRMVSSLKRQGLELTTVIDVGANIGQFTVACANLYPGVTVHAFEPQPGCVEELKRHVKSFPNVRVYPIALGEVKGGVAFNINAHNHSSSFLSLGERHRSAFPGARETGRIKVQVSTLDSEMRAAVLDGPVLLKLDVQGYEPQVLEGGADTLKRVDYIVLEASFRPMYDGEKTFMEIVGIMDASGFEFLRPVGWLDDPNTGEVLQADALFMRRGIRS